MLDTIDKAATDEAEEAGPAPHRTAMRAPLPICRTALVCSIWSARLSSPSLLVNKRQSSVFMRNWSKQDNLEKDEEQKELNKVNNSIFNKNGGGFVSSGGLSNEEKEKAKDQASSRLVLFNFCLLVAGPFVCIRI